MVVRATNSAIAPWLAGKATRLDLQRLAGLIGVPVSGTKPELLTCIQDAIDTAQTEFPAMKNKNAAIRQTQRCSVVSLDMGIRNLAYAHFTSQQAPGQGRERSVTLTTPVLQAWRRVSIGRESFEAASESTTDSENAALEDSDNSAATEESFEPIDLATHAYVCARHILQLQPSHILIERQRFRSGGHAAVQEWSLRVGVFEGMLYATLRTLAEEGRFQGLVTPMLPARVNRYWLQDSDQSSKKAEMKDANVARLNGKEAKQAKIDLVSTLLEAAGSPNSEFEIGSGAEDTVNTFMDSYEALKSRRRPPPGSRPVLKKLDDLSDSLLQGLAWMQWQNNRLMLRDEMTNQKS